MLSASEERFIASRAYVPEHVPGYVVAISGTEPYLIGDYLCYRGRDSVVFIGYPLRSPFDETAMREALGSAVARFAPRSVALTAPVISLRGGACRTRGSDRYYRLHVSDLRIDPKVRSILRRASRELHVESGREIGEEHRRLIAGFLDLRQVSVETRYIFERIPAYVSSVPSSQVFSARDGRGDLVAFDVAEFDAGDYAFYQFNFRSKERYVPGASDLLLGEVVRAAREQGKMFLNLGLGISEGVRHFKEKWGGVPFLDYEWCRYEPGGGSVFDGLLGKL